MNFAHAGVDLFSLFLPGNSGKVSILLSTGMDSTGSFLRKPKRQFPQISSSLTALLEEWRPNYFVPLRFVGEQTIFNLVFTTKIL